MAVSRTFKLAVVSGFFVDENSSEPEPYTVEIKTLSHDVNKVKEMAYKERPGFIPQNVEFVEKHMSMSDAEFMNFATEDDSKPSDEAIKETTVENK